MSTTWLWVVALGAAGGAASGWLTRRSARVAERPRDARLPGALLRRLGAVALAAATAGATAWMVDARREPGQDVSRELPSALVFFWVGFVTAGWVAAERDKRVLREAVCRAATAPAAHPDAVRALDELSADGVYEAVTALVPRRMAR